MFVGHAHEAVEAAFDLLSTGSASRRAPIYMQQDFGMPILERLFHGGPDAADKGRLPSEAIMLEGLQVTHDITSPVFQMREGASVFLGKRVILDPTDRHGPTTYRAILAASFWDSLSQLDMSTALYQRTICNENEIIQTRSAEISVGKADMPFAIACTWTLKPLDYDELKFSRILMNVTSLSLAVNESLVLEYSNGTHWSLLHHFKGPLENSLGEAVTFENKTIREVIIKTAENTTHGTNSTMLVNSTRTLRVIKHDTHFDLPLDLRIRFSAPGA